MYRQRIFALAVLLAIVCAAVIHFWPNDFGTGRIETWCVDSNAVVTSMVTPSNWDTACPKNAGTMVVSRPDNNQFAVVVSGDPDVLLSKIGKPRTAVSNGLTAIVWMYAKTGQEDFCILEALVQPQPDVANRQYLAKAMIRGACPTEYGLATSDQSPWSVAWHLGDVSFMVLFPPPRFN